MSSFSPQVMGSFGAVSIVKTLSISAKTESVGTAIRFPPGYSSTIGSGFESLIVTRNVRLPIGNDC